MADRLHFVSTLIWQSIVVGCLYFFSSELRGLLKRVLSVKHGDTEVQFQQPEQPTAEQIDPSPLVTHVLNIRDEEGFFTQYGITELVKESNYFDKNNDRVNDSILIFCTETQHTWLIATAARVFFVLDDEKTRANKRLIQNFVQLTEALPARAQKEDAETGSFKLGTSAWWYYSQALLGSPEKAANRLTAFVNAAKNSNA